MVSGDTRQANCSTDMPSVRQLQSGDTRQANCSRETPSVRQLQSGDTRQANCSRETPNVRQLQFQCSCLTLSSYTGHSHATLVPLCLDRAASLPSPQNTGHQFSSVKPVKDGTIRVIYLNINQLDALNFITSLFHAFTCFEHTCSSSGGQNYTIQPLVQF